MDCCQPWFKRDRRCTRLEEHRSDREGETNAYAGGCIPNVGLSSYRCTKIGIDCLASSGHKGLGGVLGTGLLYIRKEIQAMFAPVILGGTGLASDRLVGPFDWQSIVESGNLNVPAIASLDAALDWHLANENAATVWRDAIQRVSKKIETTDRLRLVGPGRSPSRCQHRATTRFQHRALDGNERIKIARASYLIGELPGNGDLARPSLRG